MTLSLFIFIEITKLGTRKCNIFNALLIYFNIFNAFIMHLVSNFCENIGVCFDNLYWKA